jgi:CheY-like chemotaxis protein
MAGVGVLKLSEQDPKRMNVLSTIEASTERGANMVRQVLSFARGVDGRRTEVDVRRLVRDIRVIVENTFLKAIRLETKVPTDLWTVSADATQLHQVLLNLCVNARDAMPRGGTLTIAAENVTLDAESGRSLHPSAQAGSYLRIAVEDTGTGMPPEVLRRLFEPFFTTKEVGKGTGLGLASCQTIIKGHGGFLRVQSEVGKGSRFEVYLPARTGKGTDVVRPAAADLPRGNGELVLVVDDEEAVRQIVSQTLETFGYRVVTAAGGSEALAIYSQRQDEIAVLIVDMMMPGMDGPTTIGLLRGTNPNVRVVGVTGARDAIGRVAVDAFLAKPFTTESLLKALADVVRRRPLAPQPA